MSIDLKEYVRDFVDFPKKGIIFKDISPLLASPDACHHAIACMRERWAGSVDVIVALDARGFIFGSMLGYEMHLPVVMARKKGKLPGEVCEYAYSLEYGESVLSMQSDACPAGTRVLIVDDLLATGGTAHAACELIKRSGAHVAGCAFVIELKDLGGRENLRGHDIDSLMIY